MEDNIITEPSLHADVDGVTVEVDGVVTHEPFSTGVVKFAFGIEGDESGDCEGDEPECPDELVEFSMPTEQAIEFAMSIMEIAHETQMNQLRATNQTIAYRAATHDCVRGRVGTLIINRSESKSPRHDAGAILVDLTYLDDVEGDGDVLHEIVDLETHIRPFDAEAKFEWLRSLVGGNHEFTGNIAIKYDNFSFEEIEEEWKERLGIEDDATIVLTPDTV